MIVDTDCAVENQGVKTIHKPHRSDDSVTWHRAMTVSESF